VNKHRALGLAYIVAGLGVSAALIAILDALEGSNEWLNLLGKGAAMPGVLAMVGAVKLATGAPFSETNARWQAMAPWKQSLLGFLLIVLGFCLIGAVIATIIHFE